MYRINVGGNLTKLMILILFATVNYQVNAQPVKKTDDLIASAKKMLVAKDYKGTIKTCNQILVSEPGNKDAHLLMADVYNAIDSVDLEILHLHKAGEIGREWDVVFKLGEAYFKKGDYPEALRYYNVYSNYKYIPEKRQFLLACKMASCEFSMSPVSDNGNKNSQGAVKEGVTFWPEASADGKYMTFNQLQGNSGEENSGKALPDSVRWKIALPDSLLKGLSNEGIKSLTEDSKIMFFTGCDRPDGMGGCDIYLMKYENGKWSDPLNAGNPVNSAGWDAQPTFFAKKRVLYFSSDRKGGEGKKDIWKAELQGFSEDGKPQWKEPVNLGNLLNTPVDEISPFVFENKHSLYFASDGHPGMGGMDIFSAVIDDEGNIIDIRNLGYPINTSYDDDGLTVNLICDTIYFSTSRQTEKGTEIFAFNLDRGIATPPMSYLKTNVTNLKTGKPLQVEIKLENQSLRTAKVLAQRTNDKGQTMYCLQLNRNYVLSISEPGYLYYSTNLKPTVANTIDKPEVLGIALQPIEIGAEVQLYNIYYETDSFRILPQSEPELMNLVTFLKNNNKLKVEIQGHTDSSGNPEANQVLSERRAKSVVDYLIMNGISSQRLKSQGYGDKFPIAGNDTQQGRTLNRRTTIKILEN